MTESKVVPFRRPNATSPQIPMVTEPSKEEKVLGALNNESARLLVDAEVRALPTDGPPLLIGYLVGLAISQDDFLPLGSIRMTEAQWFVLRERMDAAFAEANEAMKRSVS